MNNTLLFFHISQFLCWTKEYPWKYIRPKIHVIEMQLQKKSCPIVLSFASNFETSFRMNISIRQKHVKYMYVYCWLLSLCVGSHTCILETSRKVLGLEPKLILVVRFTFFSKKDTVWGLSKYFRKNVLCNKVNC